MPRTTEQNEIIKEERSNDILAAALNLFAAVGYRNVSVDLITQTVNCSHGLFYHYYDSKDDIFTQLIKGSEDFAFDPFNLKEFSDLRGFDGLKKIAYYFGSEKVLNEAFLCYAKIFLQDSSNKIVSAYFEDQTGFKTVDDLLVSLIKRGQDKGDVINGDSEEIAKFVKTALLAYLNDILQHKRKDRKFTDPKILLGFLARKPVK